MYITTKSGSDSESIFIYYRYDGKGPPPVGDKTFPLGEAPSKAYEGDVSDHSSGKVKFPFAIVC